MPGATQPTHGFKRFRGSLLPCGTFMFSQSFDSAVQSTLLPFYTLVHRDTQSVKALFIYHSSPPIGLSLRRAWSPVITSGHRAAGVFCFFSVRHVFSLTHHHLRLVVPAPPATWDICVLASFRCPIFRYTLVTWKSIS